MVRGIRGAITVERDDANLIIKRTRELLKGIQAANPDLAPEDIGSILFTVTEDVRSVFPAKAARELGWTYVPLLCFCEIPVRGSLPLCIRVLINWNTEKGQRAIQHVYLRGAQTLRPDLEEE